ncbi:MAG: RdgB/HAM1 family non-canonical purine NTP pyrophosphatase [Chitinophagales bacterium]
MTELVFATNNKNKIREISRVVPSSIKILSLADIGCLEELPETHYTIEDNSKEKAEFVFEKYGYNCFSEDSGLEVMALNGEPGVYSAHYAGSREPEKNNNLLLLNLRNVDNRKAQFKTVITLVIDNRFDQFTGIVTGKIAEVPRGNNGFGYDPVFIPDGFNQTFAEMEPDEKIAISHRTKAFNSMTDYLTKNF